jgi:NAD+ kinase
MRIGIHGKDFQQKSSRFIERLLDYLLHYQAEIWVSDKFLKQVRSSRIQEYKLKSFSHEEHLRPLDFFFSLGGDGTLLESVTYVGKSETPILGINTGRLGFLATTGRDETEKSLDALFKGNYTIDSRTLLKFISTPKLFGKLNFALNDFTIMKKDTSSTYL